MALGIKYATDPGEADPPWRDALISAYSSLVDSDEKNQDQLSMRVASYTHMQLRPRCKQLLQPRGISPFACKSFRSHRTLKPGIRILKMLRIR